MKLLFDIGATHIRVSGTRDNVAFIRDPVVVRTPELYREGLGALVEAIKTVAKNEPIDAVGGGVAGPFDTTTGVLVAAPNIPDWAGKPLRDDLAKALNTKIVIDNDSAVVGLGEMHFGAGRATGITAYITVSTGVGGARYVDGEIDRKALSFEPGHQIIDPDRSMCPDCESGELESYIGGAATERRMGKKPYEIKELGFWDTYAKFLAYGLHNTIAHWSPELVILGGSMIVGDPAISVPRTGEYLEQIAGGLPMPELKKASLGDFGGLYGAMVLLEENEGA